MKRILWCVLAVWMLAGPGASLVLGQQLRSHSEPKPEDPLATAEKQAHLANLLEKAFEHLEEANYKQAADMFKTCLSLDPGNKKARFGLGTVYIKIEEYQSALDLLSKLMEENPKEYFIKNNVAWLYATAKDPDIRDGDRAIALAQEALIEHPMAHEDYHVWSTLSEGYYITGRYQKAYRAAREAYQLGHRKGASESAMLEYIHQVDKCRSALEAMSLLE